MKEIILISDIHNNYNLLQKAIEKNAGKQIMCLGDIIGYNEEFDINQSIREIRENNIYSIAGNWDRMVNMKQAPGLNYKGDDEAEKTLLKEQMKFGGTVPNNKYYNLSTKSALEAILAKITKENKNYLNSLNDTYSINGVYYFIHGGFHETQLKNGLAESGNFDVKQFNYNALITESLSKSQLVPGKIIFHGHTHKASVLYDGNYVELSAGSLETFEIDNKEGAVISLPSIGRKAAEPDFSGYVVLKIFKEKTKLRFFKI